MRAPHIFLQGKRPAEPPHRDGGGRGELEVGVLRTALWDWDAGGRCFWGQPARFVSRKQAVMMMVVVMMRTEQRGGFPHTHRTAAVTINPQADFQADA